MLSRYLCLLLIFLTSFLASLIVSANNTTKLEAINKNITQLKTDINQQQQQKKTEQADLKKIEIAIGILARKIEKTQQQKKNQQHELTQLDQKQQQLQAKLQQQQQALAAEIRTAYMLGSENSLKLLLNQHNAQELSRNLTYYQYIAKERADIIEQVKQTLQELQMIQQQIEQQTKRLNKTELALTHEKAAQENNKHTRLAIITKINAELSNKRLHLATLVKNKQALEQLIATIERQRQQAATQAQAQPTTNNNQPFSSSVAFANLQGKLNWPTAGKLSQRFGQRVEDSQLQAQGVIISAPSGEKVYAIAAGKVVFAHWMQGYGLLLIIDHGGNYMSIYGRNNSLYVKNGDVVSQGQLIAEVGNSGGYTKPGLYFSIRHGAVALNPSHWCQSQPRKTQA